MKSVKNLTKSEVQNFLLYAIAIVFAFIGVYHGALGFSSIMDTPLMAWVFMGAIGLGMLLIDVKLKNELEEKRKTHTIVKFISIYAVLASVNMLGNFNAFFTKPIKENLIAEERDALKIDLSKLASFASEKIEQHSDVEGIRQSVNAELGNLKNEITDPKNQGIGDEAVAILERLSGLLGNTKIQPPTSGRLGTPGEALGVFENLRRQIIERMEAHIKGLNSSVIVVESAGLIEKAQSKKIQLDEASRSPQTNDDEEAMKDAKIAYNDLLAFMRAHFQTNDFVARSIKTENIGQYFYAVKIAREGKYKEAAWLALFQALFIDFIVPVIFLVVIGGKKDEQLNDQIEKLKKELTGEREHITVLQSKVEQLKGQLTAIRQSLAS